MGDRRLGGCSWRPARSVSAVVSSVWNAPGPSSVPPNGIESRSVLRHARARIDRRRHHRDRAGSRRAPSGIGPMENGTVKRIVPERVELGRGVVDPAGDRQHACLVRRPSTRASRSAAAASPAATIGSHRMSARGSGCSSSSSCTVSVTRTPRSRRPSASLHLMPTHRYGCADAARGRRQQRHRRQRHVLARSASSRPTRPSASGSRRPASAWEAARRSAPARGHRSRPAGSRSHEIGVARRDQHRRLGGDHVDVDVGLEDGGRRSLPHEARPRVERERRRSAVGSVRKSRAGSCAAQRRLAGGRRAA